MPDACCTLGGSKSGSYGTGTDIVGKIKKK
jgi:hypothetical protein